MANKESIESLLAEIWKSGFLRKNELIKKEILNNNYGLFHKGREFSSLKKRRAYYIKEKVKKDRVMLNKNLFYHIGLDSKGKYIIPIEKKIKATIVHELFHDFWHNILDERKKLLFLIEAEIFFFEVMKAKTKEDKVMFLNNIGLNEPSEDDFKPYEELHDLKECYSDKKFFGSELYSIIASMAFSGKMIIPKQLRKFYYSILSDSALNKNRI